MIIIRYSSSLFYICYEILFSFQFNLNISQIIYEMASVDQYRWKYIKKNGQCAFCEIYAFHTSQV